MLVQVNGKHTRTVVRPLTSRYGACLLSCGNHLPGTAGWKMAAYEEFSIATDVRVYFFLYVETEGIEADRDLETWIGRGGGFAGSLPSKQRLVLGHRKVIRRAWAC